MTREERRDRRSGKGCWYYIAIHECPVCGAGREYRERRPPPRPANDSERYEYSQDVACSDHFI
jgi:hypothetical protein